MYDVKAGKGKKLSHPMVLSPSTPMRYFELKEPFNIGGLLKNPMAIMVGVSLLMFICMKNMPKPDA